MDPDLEAIVFVLPDIRKDDEVVRLAREREEQPASAWRRRLFPWRIRLERLG